MPQINPHFDQKMKSTTHANYGDERWNDSKKWPDDEGITEAPMTEFQSKGYNATSDQDKGGN